MSRKGALPDEVRVFITQALACFDTPSTVVDAVKKEFGLTTTRQAVEAHDPTKVAGANLAERFKALFTSTREAFKADTADIAISHRSTRLRALQRMAEKAESMNNLALAAQLHEQAAKEMGEAYTNRRELTGKGGTPLVPVQPAAVIVLPDNGRG